MSRPAALPATPLVAVVIPVYNVERYLDRCLHSVVRQSWQHLEILVVDDGSTDGSGALCDAWAARDSRITVIHKPNGGLSDARNAALDVMTADLVFMLDSDDYIQLDTIAELVSLLTCYDADVAVGGWRDVYDDGSAEGSAPIPADIDTPTPHANVRTYSRGEALQAIFYQHRLTHSAWGRLYRASLFDGVRYPVGRLYEDLAVALPLYSRAERVALTGRPFYNYLQRPTSILGTFKRQRTDVLDILDALECEVAATNPPLLPAVRSRRLSACFNIMLLCPPGSEWDDVRQRCWHGVQQLRAGCFADVHIRLKNRLGIIASMLGQRAFLALFKH